MDASCISIMTFSFVLYFYPFHFCKDAYYFSTAVYLPPGFIHDCLHLTVFGHATTLRINTCKTDCDTSMCFHTESHSEQNNKWSPKHKPIPKEQAISWSMKRRKQTAKRKMSEVPSIPGTCVVLLAGMWLTTNPGSTTHAFLPPCSCRP
ncbi:hypothetical protein GUJ93_ZPchr0387g2492 [Zizania palustris]|uniref:Uncharacterized protein n=1 Tax=Zizania palustris TaxID=103762 RepID=A0A8J5RTN9_ZIZPA|nr:hypothetical protein GUJ93_ZPchr0387g2492 [Zizania palustris]